MRRLILPALLLLAVPAAAQMHDRIYPAPTAPLSLSGLPAGAALMRVTTADGLALTGVEITGLPDKPVVLLFHGNGSAADAALGWLAPLTQRG